MAPRPRQRRSADTGAAVALTRSPGGAQRNPGRAIGDLVPRIAVAKTGYLVDDRFTFADINLLPILYRVRQFPEGAEALAAAAHLARYYERHAARPSFTSTNPPTRRPAEPDQAELGQISLPHIQIGGATLSSRTQSGDRKVNKL
jgi:glutathione S-transferase